MHKVAVRRSSTKTAKIGPSKIPTLWYNNIIIVCTYVFVTTLCKCNVIGVCPHGLLLVSLVRLSYPKS